MSLLAGKVAVVTGAGRGIGKEHALLMAKLGAKVVVNDLGAHFDGTGAPTATPAQEVVAEIKKNGGDAIANGDNVADFKAAKNIVDTAIKTFGKLNIVVNNAGILRDKAFHNLEWENLNAVLDVHLKGAFHVTRPAFRRMREQSYGRIVVTSSNSGLLGNFGQSNYGAAKMGLVGLMNVLKLEGAKYDIKVNAIAPVAHTRMTEDILGPVAEKLEPGLVSPVVAYLCSQACAVTGEIFSAAGGTVSRMFIGLTPGWFKHPERDGALTPEDVEANLAAIRAETGYVVPASNQDELQKIAPLLFS
jgi:NAD(P)-dependent dehydrogenase (short-subunit alcohol dehydrogenase family)